MQDCTVVRGAEILRMPELFEKEQAKMIERLLKENPDYTVTIQYDAEEHLFLCQISINGICIFDDKHEKLHVATGSVVNQVRESYAKTDPPRKPDDYREQLKELYATRKTCSDTPFAKTLRDKTFHEVNSVADKKKGFDEISGASSRINEFVLSHLRRVNAQMAEMGDYSHG